MPILDKGPVPLLSLQQTFSGRLPGLPSVCTALDAAPDAGGQQPLRVPAVE
ncbi:hypothetical protein [Paenibacillus sp. FSL P4-0081]|uniref:hypothetical protein n=1 Tax=Paenibacillus sp. FSL P4-0081 TaxID=1536769 RepID=UPI0012E0A50A|nr:hypothetical protein [Paenibacillus sp. FSL P4-0081]